MVALVSGSGLGLTNTSRELAGNAGQLGEAGFGRAGEQVTVNTATGNLVIQNRDEFVVGVGDDLGLVRTYNSLGSWDGDNADGWRLGYYRRVTGLVPPVNTAGSTIKRTDADGFESTYTYSGGKYVGKDGSGSFDTMTFASGVWTWVDGSTGTKETYVESPTGSGSYRLDRVTDVEGHSTRLTYHSTSGLISTIASWKAGATVATSVVTLGYDNTTKRLNEMSTVAAGATRTRVRYEYDTSGRLSTVRTDLSPEDASMADGRVYAVTYGYDGSGRVNNIVQTDGTSLAIEYDTAGRVSKYTDGLGRATTLTYDTTARTTSVLDALGGTTVLTYDTAQRLLDVSGAALGGAAFKQSLTWDPTDGNLSSVKNAAGELVTFGYDTNGNRTRSTDADGNVVEYGYDAANHTISQTAYTVRDPDGVAGAGVASGALKTRNLYDGTATNRLRFTISPEGRVTQNVYNLLGQRESSTTYTGALYTAKPAPLLGDLTAWVAGLSAAELAAAQKKDYGYDALGQLMSIKSYTTVGGTPAEQRFAYDAFGRLLQSTDATGNVTSYTYDGLDRVTLTQDGANRVTLYQYDDAGNRVVVRKPADNSTEVSVFDKAGQLVSKSDGTGPQPVVSRTFLQAATAVWAGYETPTSGLGFATATGASLSTGDTATTQSRTISGQRIHRFDSGTVFSATIKVPAVATGQYFTVGAANVSGSRYHRALIRDGALYVQFVEGGVPKEVLLSASVVAGTAYQVDVETGDAGSVLYVHTGDRAAGFMHRANATDWGTARAQLAAQTSAGRSVQVMHIQSLAEWRLAAEGNVLFDQKFGVQGGAAGVNGWPASNSLFATGANGLTVQTRLAGLANAEQTVFGDAIYSVTDSDAVLVRAEVTTSATANGRNLRIGIANSATGVDARALTARFINGDLYAEYRNTSGAWVQFKLSSATKLVKDGQPYVVEVNALAAGGAQLSVYERGSTAANAAAFTYTLPGTAWKDQRFTMSAFGDAAAVSAASTVGRVQEIQLAAPSVALRTTYAYDKLGRVRQVIDGLGQRSHMLYDVSGRKVADIDATGRFTEYVYDGAGRLVQTVVSDLPLSAAQLASLTDASGNPAEVTLASVRPAVDADDRVTTRYYDKAGQLVGSQDGVGYQTEVTYDGAGRVVSTVARATASTVTRVSGSASTLATAPVRPTATADTTNDRVARSFYTADGLLQATLDADGFLVDYEYDAAGRRIAETRWSEAVIAGQRAGARSAMTPVARPADRRTLYFYDGTGRLEGDLDADGYLTRYGYDLAGRLTTTTRYLSTARLTVTAGANNTATHLARAGLTVAGVMPTVTTNVVTTRSYTGAGELAREATPDGAVTRYTYDGNGRVLTTSRGLEATPRVTRTEYTAAGQVAAEVDALNNRITHTYDAAGRRVSTTDARNNVTVYYYDASGLLRYTVLKTELGGEVTVYPYTGFGQLSKQPIAYANRLSVADTAALVGGTVTSTLVTKFQTLTDATRDANITYTYNKRGELVQETDGQGLRTFHNYTAFGQKSADHVELAGGKINRTEWKYDRRGNLVREEIDPTTLKLVSTREYDAFGRETARVDALLNRITTEYRTNDGVADSGRKVIVTDPDGIRTIVYDALDRTVATIDRLNNKTTYVHDTANRRLTMTTAEGIRTITDYAATGEVVRVFDGNNIETVYTYDANGRLQTTKDALNNVTENTYDQNGNVTKVATGLKFNSGAAASNDGSAVVTTYTFDAANRVLTRTVDPTGAALNTTYQYDGRSRQVRIVDANGTVTTQAFTTRGYLSQVVVDDVTGGLKLKTTYGYDVTGRVLTVTEAADTAAARVTQYVYDDAGRRTLETVDPTGLKLTTAYTYDKAGNVVLKRDALGHATRYVYDQGGRVKYEIDATGAVTQRSYDAEGHLTQVKAYAKRLSENHAVRVWYEQGTNSDIHTPIGRFVAGDKVTATVRFKSDIEVAGAMFLGDAGGADPYDNDIYDFKPGTRDADGWQTITMSWTMTHDDDMWVFLYGRDGSSIGDSTIYDALTVTSTLQGTVLTEGFEGSEIVGRSGVWAGSPLQSVRVQTDIVLAPNLLTDAQINTAVTSLASAADQVTSFAYDKDGRQVFSLDAAGGLTQTKYTKTGLVAETIRYATPFVGALTASITPTKDAAKDQSTATVYDVIGRPRFIIDARNFLRDIRYDRQGHATTTVAYAAEITRPATIDGTTVWAAISNKLDAVNDRTTYQAYDTAGRMRFMQDAAGYMNEYVYDGLGNVTQTLRHEKPYTFSTVPPTVAQFQQVTRTTTTFAGGLDGYAGTAGEWQSGQVKLVSQASSNGNWSIMTGPREMAPGSSLKFDITPQSMQAELHTGIEAQTGASGRVVFLWRSDGSIAAQFTAEDNTYPAVGGLGSYSAGTTYTVEIATDTAGGASMYLYAKGQSRESGIVYRVPSELKWTSFKPTFYTYTAAGLTATTTALLDNVEERAASITSTRYDAAGRAVTSVAADGSVTKYAYDTLGRQTDVTVAAGTPLASTTHRVFDQAGNVIEETTAYGTSVAASTLYRYDSNGRLLAKTDARGVAEAASLTGTARIAALAKYTTRYAYDALGQLTTTIDALRGMTLIDHDVFGNAVRQVDARGYVTTTHYDKLNRAVQVVDAERYLTVNRYDAFGNVDRTIKYAQRVERPFDGPVTVIASGGTAPGTGAYLIEVAAQTQTTILEYNRRNEKTRVVDAESHVESTEFTAFGQAATSTNRQGATAIAKFKYDRLGRMIEEELPVTSLNANREAVPVVNKYAYDAYGNRIRTIEASGLPEQRTTQYVYDAVGREVRKIGDSVKVFVAGMSAPVDATPTERIRYDALGRVIEKVDANGARTLSYYDVRGLKYAELTQVEIVNGTAMGRLQRWGFDAVGQATSVRAHGVAVAMPVLAGGTPPDPVADGATRETRYEFDALGRLWQETSVDVTWFARPNNNALDDETLRTETVLVGNTRNLTTSTKYFDAAGNVVAEVDGRGVPTYNYYDGLGRRIVQVDRAQYVTRWTYTDNTVRERRYANPFTGVYGMTTVPSLIVPTESVDDRITTTTTDRLGRVVLKIVSNVQAGYLTSATAGTYDPTVQSAVTSFEYDGLGNITRQVDPDNAEKYFEFDALGRQTWTRSAYYNSHEGESVRQRTQTVYNGLGLVAREVQYDRNDLTDAGDRVTLFTYEAGRLTSRTTPTASVQYNLDAAGNRTRETSEVVTGEGTKLHRVTLRYDALGHEVWRETGYVGETGQTAEILYNVFGEITGKRQNGGGAQALWQEKAEYDKLGRVVRSNSAGGVYKLYGYDQNGNAVLTVESRGTDISGQNIDTAVSDATLSQYISFYDVRDQLVDYIQPDVATFDVTGFLSSTTVGASGGEAHTLTVKIPPTNNLPVYVAPTKGTVGVSFVAPGSTLSATISGQLDAVVEREVAPTYNGSYQTSAGFSSGHFVLNGVSITVPLPDLGWYGSGNYVVEYVDQAGTASASSVGRFATITLGRAAAEGSYSVSIYKEVGGGVRELVASASGSHGFGRFTSGYRYPPAPEAKKLTVSLVATARQALNISEQPAGAQSVRLTLRHQGTGPTVPLTAGRKVVNGSVQSNWFAVDLPALAEGTYDFTYDALDGAGGTVNSGSGTLKVSASGMSVSNSGGAPSAEAIAGNAFLSGSAGTIRSFEAHKTALAPSTPLAFTVNTTNLQVVQHGGYYGDSITNAINLNSVTVALPSIDVPSTEAQQNTYRMEVRYASNGGLVAQNAVKENPGASWTATMSTGVLPDDALYTLTLIREVNGRDVLIGSSTFRLNNGGDNVRSLPGGYYTTQAYTYPTVTGAIAAAGISPSVMIKRLDTSVVSMQFGYRVRGSASPYEFVAMSGNGAASLFSLDMTQRALDANQQYEFIALGFNSAGQILDRQSGIYTHDYTTGLSDLGAIKTSELGFAVFERQGGVRVLNLFDQGAGYPFESRVTEVTIRYRRVGAGGEYSAPVTLGTSARTDARGFSLSLAGWADGDYDFIIDRKRANGATDRGIGRLNNSATPSILSFGSFNASASTVKFLDMPGATRLTLTYRVTKAGDPQYLLQNTETFTTTGGEFAWGAHTFVDTDPTATFIVDYSLTAVDDNGLLVARATGGRLQLGLAQGKLVDPTLDRRPTLLDFAPGVANAATMKLYYRVRPTYSSGQTATDDQLGGDAAAPFTEVTQALVAQPNGHFSFDAKTLRPDLGSRTYDYMYIVRDANGQYLAPRTGQFTLGDGVVNGGAEMQQRIDIALDPDRIIHRKREYNAFGEISVEEDGLRNRTRYTYNTLGLMVKKTDPGASVTHENGYVEANVAATTSYLYSLGGLLQEVTDANDNATGYRYGTAVGADGRRQVMSEHHADTGSKLFGYDEFGQLRSARDELLQTTKYDYDAGGRLRKLTRPTRTASAVTGAGITGGGTPTEYFEYDSRDRRIRHTNAANVATVTDYDAADRVTGTRTADGTKTTYTYTYDNTIRGVGGQQVGGYRKVTSLYGIGSTIAKTQVEHIDVFGHNTYLSDFDAHDFTYTYNHAGWLVSQRGVKSNQDIVYDYLANGYVSSITDRTLKVKTSYGYDRQGNRTGETNEVLVQTGTPPHYFQAAFASYDALGRVTEFRDNMAKINYEYDAVGNVRRILADYVATDKDDRKIQDNWYSYDSMNRFVVTQGQLFGPAATSKSDGRSWVVTGDKGVFLMYDVAGRRVAARYGDYNSATYQGVETDPHMEYYTYTTDGYLETVQMAKTGEPTKVLAEVRQNDLAGRVEVSRQYQPNANYSSSSLFSTRTTQYHGDNRVKTVSATTNGNTSSTEYKYDADGTLGSTVQTGSSNVTTTYKYEWWGDARQSLITTSGGGMNGDSAFTYDANGHTASVAVKDDEGVRNFKYTNNAEGQILMRDERIGDQLQRWRRYYYLSGKRVGDVSNDGPSREDYAQALARSAPNSNPDQANRKFTPIYSADFDQNYEPISPTYPGAASGTYTVQEGDTLQRVAMAVWGDGAMWYLLADANGLTGNETLVQGQTLVVPNKVTNIHHNAQTQRVYNAGEAMGKVDPVLPSPPPPEKGGCGALGTIIMVVIAVIVTIYTAGAAAGAMGAAISSTGAVTVGAAGTVSATIGATATAAVAGAAGAAAGSIASQLAGMAMGMQDNFSWKAVGQAALGGAVTGGLANQFAGMQSMASMNTTVRAGLQSAAGTAMTQALQGKWNWRGIMASGLSAAAGSAVGAALGKSSVMKDYLGGRGGLIGRVVTNMSATAVSQLVGTGKVDPRSVWANAVGSAVGSLIADTYDLQAKANKTFMAEGGAKLSQSSPTSAREEPGAEAEEPAPPARATAKSRFLSDSSGAIPGMRNLVWNGEAADLVNVGNNNVFGIETGDPEPEVQKPADDGKLVKRSDGKWTLKHGGEEIVLERKSEYKNDILKSRGGIMNPSGEDPYGVPSTRLGDFLGQRFGGTVEFAYNASNLIFKSASDGLSAGADLKAMFSIGKADFTCSFAMDACEATIDVAGIKRELGVARRDGDWGFELKGAKGETDFIPMPSAEKFKDIIGPVKGASVKNETISKFWDDNERDALAALKTLSPGTGDGAAKKAFNAFVKPIPEFVKSGNGEVTAKFGPVSVRAEGNLANAIERVGPQVAKIITDRIKYDFHQTINDARGRGRTY